eukprot:2113382-Rhodomonas_salina.1
MRFLVFDFGVLEPDAVTYLTSSSRRFAGPDRTIRPISTEIRSGGAQTAVLKACKGQIRNAYTGRYGRVHGNRGRYGDAYPRENVQCGPSGEDGYVLLPVCVPYAMSVPDTA